MDSGTDKISPYNIDGWAKCSYDRFRIQQPHISTNGLWKSENHYFISCPDYNDSMLSVDGRPLKAWFEYHKIIGVPIQIVKIPPDGSKKLNDHKMEEVIQQSGEPFNMRGLHTSLLLELGPSFPDFLIREDFNKKLFVIITSVELNSDYKKQLDIAFEALNLVWYYRLEVAEGLKLSNKQFRLKGSQGDIDLIPSKYLSPKISSKLKMLWEKDEEYWIDNRLSSLGGMAGGNISLPKNWQKKSACFLNTTNGSHPNLRNYLTLYSRVILALPLDISFKKTLSSLSVSEKELIELVRLSRVQLILPHSIDRYPIRILETIAESAPENLLFSRRLGCVTLNESQKRFPVLCPELEMEGRIYLLKALCQIAEDKNAAEKRFIISLVKAIGTTWMSIARVSQQLGAFGVNIFGIGNIISDLYESITEKERKLEFSFAGTSVEWSTALNAVLYPVNITRESPKDMHFSRDIYTEIIASIYSGLSKKGVEYFDSDNIFSIGDSMPVIENVLSVEGNVPVIEFAKSFKNGDIDRFRNLIEGMQARSSNVEEFVEAASKFNAEVKRYEKRSKFLKKHDLKWLIELIAPAVASSQSLKAGVFSILGLWLFNNLNKYRGANKGLGQVLDFLEGKMTLADPKAVMIARMKKNIKSGE